MKRKSLMLLCFVVTLLAVQQYGLARGATLRDVISEDNAGNFNTKVCYHSTGRIVYSMFLGVDLIHVRVYSSVGTFLGSVNVTESGDDKFLDVSVTELDDDEVMLFIIMRRQSATDFFYAVVYRINIVSYSASSQYNVLLWSVGSAGAGTGASVSNLHNYTQDGSFYGIGQLTWNTPSGQGYYVGVSFDPSTNTVAKEAMERSTEDTFHFIYEFYNTSALYESLLFFVSSSMIADTPQYYTYDMSSGTFTLLCNHPVGSVFPYGDRRLNFLGAGLDNYSGNAYLYFSWEYSYTSASNRRIRIEQGRSVYNGSIISNTTLLGSGRSSLAFTPYLGTGSDAFSFGYAPEKDEIIVYYANIYDSEYEIAELNCSLQNWYDYSPFDSNIDAEVTHASDVDVVYHLITDYVFTTPTGTLEFNEYSGNTYVYYMDLPMLLEYGIDVDYVPSHDPLQIDTNYIFTATTTINGNPTSLKVTIYWDGSFQTSDSTSIIDGTIDLQINTLVRGIHTLTIYLYDWENELQKTSSTQYMFSGDVPTEDITPDDTTYLTINMLITMLPTFTALIIPTSLFLAIDRSAVMLMVGLTVGSVICVISGLLPLYTVFIFVICDLLIVFTSRRM